MRDRAIPSGQESTARRELFTYVIGDSWSCRHRPSCDLNQVLTLRGIGRSAAQRSAVVQANDSRKV